MRLSRAHRSRAHRGSRWWTTSKPRGVRGHDREVAGAMAHSSPARAGDRPGVAGVPGPGEPSDPAAPLRSATVLPPAHGRRAVRRRLGRSGREDRVRQRPLPSRRTTSPNAHSRQFVENTVALGHDVFIVAWPGASAGPEAAVVPARPGPALRTMDVVYVRLEHRPPVPCRWAVGPSARPPRRPSMVWEFNTVPEFGVYVDEAPSRIARNIEGFGASAAAVTSPSASRRISPSTCATGSASNPRWWPPTDPIPISTGPTRRSSGTSATGTLGPSTCCGWAAPMSPGTTSIC